ncbi:hypothetical protein JCM10207_006715 [Rhodosporidiobolus poonsookiae]
MSLLAAFSSTCLSAASPLFPVSPLPMRKASKPASQILFTGLSHAPIRAYGTLEATAIDLRILRWAKDVHVAISSSAEEEASPSSPDPLAHLVDPTLSPNVTVRKPRRRRAAPSPSSAASSRPSLLFDSPSSVSASSCTSASPSVAASPAKAKTSLPPVVRAKVNPLCPTPRRRSSPLPSPSSPAARLRTRAMPPRTGPVSKSGWK